MVEHRFTCNYKSGAGVWAKGEIADLDDETAAWLLRDVAGCIVPVDASLPVAEERAIKSAPKDRQLKKALNDRQIKPDDGVMTPDNSGAVRRKTDFVAEEVE